ncbi:putative peptidase S10, serine carboxypeptidase, serine carboxypeptidase, serine active [Septoria linicola]|nr:putative peptidase S10, serine carboxypeptidase, serine carboxypeptidase, serine active [Septoria linicola]
MKAFTIIAGAMSAAAQFVPMPTDLDTTTGNGYPVRYKEVPAGICETVEGVRSFSGYVDVEDNQHLFFWLFEARNQDPTAAPLTLWLNGGPGDPSMVGLFSENGPCWVDYEGNVQRNDYSWTNASNVLFIDQPAGTGFSYTDIVNGYIDEAGYLVTLPEASCPDYANAESCGTWSSSNASETVNNTLSAVPYIWQALAGVTGAFPQYSSNGIHVSTESYGGHYGPVLADYILDKNADLPPGAETIALRSLTVGNGWFDPITQFEAYYNFTIFPGNTYGFAPFNSTSEEQLYNALYGEGNCLDQLHDCNFGAQTDGTCSAADNFCYDMVEYLYDTVTERDEYDLRQLMPNPFAYTAFVAYLNRADIQQAIGASTNFSYSVSNLGVGTVSTAFGTTGDDSRGFDIIAKNKRLVDEGVYVVHYAGDADYNCNWLGGESVAEQIAAPDFGEAGYQNFTTLTGDAETVHGAVKQAGNYAFIRVYDSGHQVAFYKPQAALTLFERTLRDSDIATGQESIGLDSGYRSIGPAKSEYQNDPSQIQGEVIEADCTWDWTSNTAICPKTNPGNSWL